MTLTGSPEQTLDIFCPGAPVEVRVLFPKQMFPKDLRYQRFDSHADAVAWADQFTNAKGTYFVMNPYDASAIKDKAVDDAAITRRRWLLIDVDVKRSDANSNSTDAELAKACEVAAAVRTYLTDAMGWPAPVEGISGNGASLHIPVDLPNDSATDAAVTGFLHFLSGMFSTANIQIDLKVANASRITKLYGTMTRKGPATDERPHRRSVLTHVPDPLRVLSEAEFKEICGFWADETPTESQPTGPVEHNVDLDARMELARGWLSVQRPAVQGEHGDAHTYQVCCAVAVEHDLGVEEALAALQDWNNRCRPPWPASELRRKIQNATKYAKGVRGCRLVQHPLTEAGDGECFASLYGDQVRYDFRRGRFLVADEPSGIWVPDPMELLTRLTTRMMRVRQRHATLESDKKKRERAFQWAITGESSKRHTNALKMARSVPPIADLGEHWDESPFLLGTQNGVVDLQTGQFRKATAADRITMRVRVAYDATATCPLWTSFLADIFAPQAGLLDAEESHHVVSFLQRAIGYSISGDCREECCFFTVRNGRNGKGTLMNTLGWLLGDYTDDMPFSTLERPGKNGGGIPSDVAKLVSKRFITCAEVNEFTLNESRLKALTGRDPITARFLHREWFTFIPVGKIWIATNNKPKIEGTDDGIWSRIHLIPFLRKYEIGNANTLLKDQLRDELPGILNWAIAGTRMWLDDGLRPPASVRAATAAYRHESNPLTPFVEACCVVQDNLRTRPAEAFAAYERFCKDEGMEPWKRLAEKSFYKSMGLMFKKQEDRSNAARTRQTWYVGVGLRETDGESRAANPERDTQCDDV